MKKIIFIFIVLFHFTISFGQSITYTYPFDVAFSLGRASLKTYSVSYSDVTMPSNFLTIGGKFLGFIFSTGFADGYSNENVLGYSKIVQLDYSKYGFEIGKLFVTTKSGKTHSFSIAPTYTKIWYGLSDTSGNNIGWSDYDNYKRQLFYLTTEETSNGRVGGFGIDIGYTYQYLGVDVSITKKCVEISVCVQFGIPYRKLFY